MFFYYFLNPDKLILNWGWDILWKMEASRRKRCRFWNTGLKISIFHGKNRTKQFQGTYFDNGFHKKGFRKVNDRFRKQFYI